MAGSCEWRWMAGSNDGGTDGGGDEVFINALSGHSKRKQG